MRINEQAGEKIRRPHWLEGQFYQWRDGKVYNEHGGDDNREEAGPLPVDGAAPFGSRLDPDMSGSLPREPLRSQRPTQFIEQFTALRMDWEPPSIQGTDCARKDLVCGRLFWKSDLSAYTSF